MLKRMRSIHKATQLVLSVALLLGVAACPGACGERYYVNSIYNIRTPNPWASMRKYKAFVDESKARGFNSINLDISWATARRDGTYDFSLFDRQVSYAISKAMYVWPRLNCSLFGGREPYWFTSEMYMRGIDGKIYKHANGCIPSITHPVVLREMVRFCTAVVKHCDLTFKVSPFGVDPIVCLPFSFTPTLEAEYFFDGELDYSQSARAGFAKWVRSAYPSLGDLNTKWRTHYTSWDEIDLVTAHPTAKELYFESRLQVLLDLVGDAVHGASPRMKVGLQTGCIWDIPKRRNFNVTPLLRKMDWLLIADSYKYPHAFSTDYTRCAANGKPVSNEIDGPGFGGGNGERRAQALETYAHGGCAVFTSNWTLEELKDRNSLTFVEEAGKLSKAPAAGVKADVAIYLSVWDLINAKVNIGTYQKAYNRLSNNGARVVDILPDSVIAGDPRTLEKYKSIYLPANYTIPDNVRSALLACKDQLVVRQPRKAGILDMYGNTLAEGLCSDASVD